MLGQPLSDDFLGKEGKNNMNTALSCPVERHILSHHQQQRLF